MKHPAILFCILFFMCAYIEAQSNFQPGFYITNQIDTVYGLIDDRGEIKNSKQCIYKTGEISEPVKFLPGEIYGFKIDDSKFYIARELSIAGHDSVVFLEYLVDGIKDLYFYPGKYFIEDEEGKLHELILEKKLVYKRGSDFIQTKKIYAGQLRYTFADCPQLFNDIDASSLTHKSLINLTVDYHNKVCDGEKCLVYHKPVPILSLKLGFSSGVNSTRVNLRQPGSYKEVDFNGSTDFQFGALVYMFLPRITERFSIGISTVYFQSYYYGFKQSEELFLDVHGHANTFIIAGSLRYAFTYNKLTPVIETGIMLIPYLFSEFRNVEEFVTSDYVYTREFYSFPLIDTRAGAFVKAGLNYSLAEKSTLNISIKYNSMGDSFLTTNRDGLALELSYLYSLRK